MRFFGYPLASNLQVTGGDLRHPKDRTKVILWVENMDITDMDSQVVLSQSLYNCDLVSVDIP